MVRNVFKAAPIALTCALITASGGALADVVRDKAKVVKVQPVYETVHYSVPVESCRVVYSEPRGRSYTGPILGAVVGGAVGHAVGHHKRNKQVGTVVGALVGGTIGADIARRHRASQGVRKREVCDVVDEVRIEERLAGYDVTYRFAGSTFTSRMDHRPGKYVPVRVRVTPLV